jgi:hypothetical protein
MYRSECQDFISDASQKSIPLTMPGLCRHDPAYGNAEYPGPWFLTEFSQHDTWIFEGKTRKETLFSNTLSEVIGSGSWKQAAGIVTRNYKQGTSHVTAEEKQNFIQFLKQRMSFEKATISFQ